MMGTHHTVIVKQYSRLSNVQCPRPPDQGISRLSKENIQNHRIRVFEAIERENPKPPDQTGQSIRGYRTRESKTTGSNGPKYSRLSNERIQNHRIKRAKVFEAIERENPKPPDQTGQSIRGYRTRESKTTGSNGSEYSRLSNLQCPRPPDQGIARLSQENIQNHRIRVFEAIERENPKPPDQTDQSIRGYRTCSVQDHRIRVFEAIELAVSKTTGSEYSRLSNLQCPKPPDQSIRGYRTCSVRDHRIRVFEAIELAVSETTGSEYLRLSNAQCPRPSEGSRLRDLRRVNRCGMDWLAGKEDFSYYQARTRVVVDGQPFSPPITLIIPHRIGYPGPGSWRKDNLSSRISLADLELPEVEIRTYRTRQWVWGDLDRNQWSAGQSESFNRLNESWDMSRRAHVSGAGLSMKYRGPEGDKFRLSYGDFIQWHNPMDRNSRQSDIRSQQKNVIVPGYCWWWLLGNGDSYG
ncbi:hypothetical protein FIBSPDRAFT_902228 [Athelia psychrophila]|uniref:Uncharacterized protein n=1 Tax=Athelia psychrophila TaxID=1759441 RepID=A0A167XGU9_9AGAM|nr:hypothetical protein FIBSPDRAFT_902228 [Fibularhizoctonia sp. CBS 109695]